MSSKSTRWLFLLPLALFLGMSVFLFKGLFSDPTLRESAVLDRPFPEFQLPDLMQEQVQYTLADLKGEAHLVNVWGTWCPTCNAELGYLTELRSRGVRIIGLYYAADFDPDFGEYFDLAETQRGVVQKLTERGDPYIFNMLDITRELGLDLGVTGAPETFLVDKEGIIRLHHVGDINPRVWESKFAKLWQELSS